MAGLAGLLAYAAALAAMATSPSPGRRGVDGDIRLNGADPSPGNDDTAALQSAGPSVLRRAARR